MKGDNPPGISGGWVGRLGWRDGEWTKPEKGGSQSHLNGSGLLKGEGVDELRLDPELADEEGAGHVAAVDSAFENGEDTGREEAGSNKDDVGINCHKTFSLLRPAGSLARIWVHWREKALHLVSNLGAPPRQPCSPPPVQIYPALPSSPCLPWPSKLPSLRTVAERGSEAPVVVAVEVGEKVGRALGREEVKAVDKE